MFGLILTALVGAKALNLANDYATISNMNRQQREAFKQTLDAGHERMRMVAEKNDLYWNPITSTCRSDFYSDGSLRHDWITNKYYSKGQYYYNCEGHGVCDNSKDKTEWAPW